MTDEEQTEETAADKPADEAPEGEAEQPAAEAGAEEAAAQEPAAEQPATEGAAEAPSAERERPARKEREIAPAGPDTAVVVAQRVPGTPIVSRRRVLQAGFWVGVGATVAATAAAGLDFIYPRGISGFGGSVSVGAADVPAPGDKRQIPVGRFWLVNLTEEQGGPGLLALWWKCPHLGCTVPWRPGFVWPDPTTGAPKQGWFRCPCHGSTYTDAGVRVFGPAPRSMDTMDLSVGSDGRVSVNTGGVTPGGPDNPDRAVRI